ncbi:MAG: DUF2752 domain-containing protein [Acidimicrobiia bacterium]|nr:DUF2752 domain-containing protein [Acidimicrobiia bacterium]
MAAPPLAPEWAGALSLAALPVAAGWNTVTAATGREPACLLRTRTGVPCPLCGGVTACRALLALDPVAAASANPVVAAAALVGLGLAVLWVARLAGAVPPPRRWSTAATRRAGLAVAGALAVSWLFQLVRWGTLVP